MLRNGSPSLLLMFKALIVGGSVCLVQTGNTEEGGFSVERLEAQLKSSQQLNVSGEQIYEMPIAPSRARQYETFALKFDRPTKRIRLSYSRFAEWDKRTEIEAWGTLDCLNLLRIDRTTPDLYTARSSNCQRLGALYSSLSEGTPVPSAPLAILENEVEGTGLQRGTATQGVKTETLARTNNVFLQFTTPIGSESEIARYWFSPDGSALTNTEKRSGDRFRARGLFRHDARQVLDSDFSFTPDKAAIALSDFAKDQNAARSRVEALARQGNKAAKAALVSSDPAMATALFGAVDQRAWNILEELQALGMPAAYTTAGQILARSRPENLPASLQAMSPKSRKERARELVLQGAKRCDGQALIELSQGTDIFEYTPQLQARMSAIDADCTVRSSPREAKSALERFAAQWPT